MDKYEIGQFLRESNEIEAIFKYPSDDQIESVEAFLGWDLLTVGIMSGMANIFQPGVLLRDKVGLDVMVGGHLPPRGGPEIRAQLEDILDLVVHDRLTPWRAHCLYEHLHPFTDCNGRTGRLLWLWHMKECSPGYSYQIPFLHKFYYQSLDEADTLLEAHHSD